MSFDFRESTAIFGGSFHPPHLAHTQAIRGLLQNPGVKRVLILPSYGTPLKAVTVSYQQRFEMAKIAFSSIPSVELSDFEKVNQTQFTWQVLEKISPQIRKPAFVIGTDQFQKLEQWAKFPEVLSMSDWIILLRKPSTLDSIRPTIQKFIQDQILIPASNDHEFTTFGKRMIFVATEAMDVSSTRIREQIALRKWDAVKNFISDEVRDYIVRNKLYGT